MQLEDNRAHSVIISIFVTQIFFARVSNDEQKANEPRAEPGTIDQTLSFKHR